MRFTDRKTLFTDRAPLLSIRSIRTDRHMAYTVRYGAGVLDNPPCLNCFHGPFLKILISVVWHLNLFIFILRTLPWFDKESDSIRKHPIYKNSIAAAPSTRPP